MEVIEKGNPWSQVCKCIGKGHGGKGCNSTLKVYETDLFVVSSTDYGGTTESWVTFKCIVCGQLNDLYDHPGHTGKYPTKKQWEENQQYCAWR